MPKRPATVFPADSHGRIWGMGIARNPMRPFLQGEGGNGGAPSRAGDGGPVPLLKTCEGPPPAAAVLLHEKVLATPAVQRRPLRIGSATRFGNNKKIRLLLFSTFSLVFFSCR